MVKVTKTSLHSGKTHTLELPISELEYFVGTEARRCGALIQDAFPGLSAEYREFLMTGITPEEWNEIFPKDE